MLATVTVTTLGGLGDGVATYNNKPLFIPKACAGDQLEVRIVHENRDGLQGLITRVIEAGPFRREAPCRYFDHCGGCTLQQLIPDAYRQFKANMLHGALERAGFPDPQSEVVFVPPHSRRRVEFKVKHDGNSVALAFHDLRSHTPTVIDECLLLMPSLQALIAPLNARLSAQDFSHALYSVGLTQADSGIELLLTFKNYDVSALPSLEPLAKDLGLARIAARTPESKAVVLAQIAPVEMQLGGYEVALPPESFLQATREGQAELTRTALEATQNAKAVVDLFCGIGSYSFPLSHHAKVHAVELDASMVATLSASVKRHGLNNISAQARDLFKQPLSAAELSPYSAAIVNPPRLGAKAQSEQIAASKINSVVMISCNPATFARDAAILKKAGFTMTSVRAMDQFLWSQHLEIVAVLQR
jgi:23S rRNA (uracil1939-C5)-methyltransferase